MLTFERLREILSYDPESGIFTWLSLPNRRIRRLSVAGAINGDGYWQIQIDGNKYKAHRLAWLYVHGEWPALQIDHIDRDKINNRIANLREATHGENQQNSRIPKTNTTGLKGVSWVSSRNLWQAHIRANGKQIYLGRFQTSKEAHFAYCAAAEKYHGQFARTA